jgi:hypothetical protein
VTSTPTTTASTRRRRRVMSDSFQHENTVCGFLRILCKPGFNDVS